MATIVDKTTKIKKTDMNVKSDQKRASQEDEKREAGKEKIKVLSYARTKYRVLLFRPFHVTPVPAIEIKRQKRQ